MTDQSTSPSTRPQYDRPRPLNDGYDRPRNDLNINALSLPAIRTAPSRNHTHGIPERISALPQSPRHQPLLTGASTASAIAVVTESRNKRSTNASSTPVSTATHSLFKRDKRGHLQLVRTEDDEHGEDCEEGFVSRNKWMLLAVLLIMIAVIMTGVLLYVVNWS